MPGPLAGCRIIELAGIGPGPFAGMMLSDMGAEVVRIDRANLVPEAAASTGSGDGSDLLGRGRHSVGVDLKNAQGVETVLRLLEKADALIEGFRPGVTERLGLGPVECLARNPKLIYGRMTGWGQDGPYASAAGHDINYIALSGVLSLIGRQGDRPLPPMNLVGDFGGGGMLLAFGVVCGILEAQRSGQGQVIDAAMVDGAALLATMIMGFRQVPGMWGERGTNMLDTGAWFYEVYETADHKFVSFGAIEPQFLAEMLRIIELPGDIPEQHDRSQWPVMKERVAAHIATRTRDEWSALLETSDACFAPVLTPDEAAIHPHNAQRGTYVNVSGLFQPAPAPRFSRTVPEISGPSVTPGAHTDQTLKAWGFNQGEIAELRRAGAVR